MTANEDSMGLTHVTSPRIMSEETEVIRCMLNKLILTVPEIKESVCLNVTNKDLKLRKSLKCNFPNTEMLICKYHVLQNFQREISLKI